MLNYFTYLYQSYHIKYTIIQYILLETIILFTIITIVSSCMSIPTQEMSDARQAIKIARETKAELYAPLTLAKAEEKLAIAQQNVETGFFSIAHHQAIAAKEQAVIAYEMAITIERARQTWQTLSNLGYPNVQLTTLIEQATRAASQDNIEETLFLADHAYQQANILLNQVYLSKAKILLDKAQIQASRFNTSQQLILKAALAAYYYSEGQKSYQLIKQLISSL